MVAASCRCDTWRKNTSNRPVLYRLSSVVSFDFVGEVEVSSGALIYYRADMHLICC